MRRLGPGHQRVRRAGSTWQGYLLEPLGLGGKDGAWAFANLGVLVALVDRVPRLAAARALGRTRQEREPSPPAA